MQLRFKQEGQTPLEALELLRHEQNIAQGTPMTYAGRLDPMAEGLLIVLSGDECKEKDQYLRLDKEYEVEILLGVGSDTGDILGKLEIPKDHLISTKTYSLPTLRQITQLLVGKHIQKYPVFSSKPVHGKPLFVHAREGMLESVEIPHKEIEIYSIAVRELITVPVHTIVTQAIERITKVSGDFRQSEIIQAWKAYAQSADRASLHSLYVLKIHTHVSSGTYMRTLAQRIGEHLGVSALAWRITRTKIGNYTIK